MTRMNVSRIVVLGSFGLVLGLVGCTSPNQNFRAYCDESGCYECGAGGVCEAVPNKRCSGSSDCGANQTCTNIGCADRCAEVACKDGLACVSGFCVPGVFDDVKPIEGSKICYKDEDCAAEDYCSGGKCIARCKSDDECAPGLVCVACGKCQEPELPATCGEQPAYCSADSSCGTGKDCKNGRCHYACSGNAACPVGQVCNAGLCGDDPAPSKPQCVLDLHCSDGTCINGYCHPFCSVSGDCGAQELCLVGVCQPNYLPAKS